MAGVAEAQTTLPDPAPSPFAVNAADGLFYKADQPSGQPSWAAERRACEGCPRRSVGHAFVDVTVINVFYGLANLVRGQVTARVTPKTWWANMEQGFVWDLDDFVVNQMGHPYQGNNYFNAARANGLSFWEAAGLTAFGSGTWEYFGETNHASLNDLVNTTLGGVALGEMFNRVAWLVRDTRATGRGRLWKEIGAMAIDPVTGAKRFLSGDSSRVSDKPEDMVPSRLGGMAMAGALWRGSNTGAFSSDPDPFLELDLLYGDPTTGRSRTPYDAFGVVLRFGGGGAFSEAKVRGRLLGQPYQNDRFQLNVLQAYDFSKNNAYQFGAQSFNVTGAYTGRLSTRLSVYTAGWGGLMPLGAIDSIPLEGLPEEPEEPTDGEGAWPGCIRRSPLLRLRAWLHFRRSQHPPARRPPPRRIRLRDASSPQSRWRPGQSLHPATAAGPAGSTARCAGHRRLGRVFRSPDLLPERRHRDEEIPLPAVPRVPDLEDVVNRRSLKAGLQTRLYAALVSALGCLMPVAAAAQTEPATLADQSRMWIVAGGTTTTLRGDCQEDCVAHGTGAYLQYRERLWHRRLPGEPTHGCGCRGVVGPGHVSGR